MYCPSEWQSFLQASAERNGVDPIMLDALIMHESTWKLSAIGDDGLAVGLGQIHPTACQTIGVDPKGRGVSASWDIEATAKYLAFCFKIVGRHVNDTTTSFAQGLALIAYNQGPTVVDRGLSYADAVARLGSFDGPK